MGILIMPEDVEIRWYREHPTKGMTIAGMPPKPDTFIPNIDDLFRKKLEHKTWW